LPEKAPKMFSQASGADIVHSAKCGNTIPVRVSFGDVSMTTKDELFLVFTC